MTCGPADTSAVSTHYHLEGTTLVQIVDHHGAVYPVVADPSWWKEVRDWAGAAAAAGGAALCIAGGCTVGGAVLAGAGVVTAATFVVGKMIPDSSTGTSRSGSNTCNMRNRRGR